MADSRNNENNTPKFFVRPEDVKWTAKDVPASRSTAAPQSPPVVRNTPPRSTVLSPANEAPPVKPEIFINESTSFATFLHQTQLLARSGMIPLFEQIPDVNGMIRAADDGSIHLPKSFYRVEYTFTGMSDTPGTVGITPDLSGEVLDAFSAQTEVTASNRVQLHRGFILQVPGSIRPLSFRLHADGELTDTSLYVSVERLNR